MKTTKAKVTTANLEAHLSRMEAFLELESLHGAHLARSSSVIAGAHFGCVFRTYWSTVVASCKDATLGATLRDLHAQGPNAHHPVFDTSHFCTELERACARGDDVTTASTAFLDLGQEGSPDLTTKQLWPKQCENCSLMVNESWFLMECAWDLSHNDTEKLKDVRRSLCPEDEIEDENIPGTTDRPEDVVAEPQGPNAGCNMHDTCDDCCVHSSRCMFSGSSPGSCQRRPDHEDDQDTSGAGSSGAGSSGFGTLPDDDHCARSCEDVNSLEDSESDTATATLLKDEDIVYPVPWSAYADVIPEDLQWLVIAADDGMIVRVYGRRAVIGTLGKEKIIVSYKDGTMENARISYEDAKTHMVQPDAFKAISKDVDPKDFSSHYLETAPPAVKEDFLAGSPKGAEKSVGDKLASQLEAFVWDKSKASPECISNDARVQSECMSNPECRCEDPLLWLRLVKGDALKSAEFPDKPLCLATSRAGEKKKYSELELEECSDKTLWIARRSIDDGRWGGWFDGGIGNTASEQGEPLVAHAAWGRKSPFSNNYQLISPGDSRGDSNEAGSVFDSLREPARCIDRRSPKSATSKIQALMAQSEFTCVSNQDLPPAPTGDAVVDDASQKRHEAATKEANDEKCARTLKGGMFWDMTEDDAKAACEAFPSSVQQLTTWQDSNGAKEEPPTGGCTFVESAPRKDDFACAGESVKKGTCNYCHSAGAMRWDVKKNGVICEDACRNCLSASHLGSRAALGHCFEEGKNAKHATADQMGLFEVVDFALWEKNHPFREDPFESLTADGEAMREAARRGVSRHAMGSMATMWYAMIGEAAEDNWPDFTVEPGKDAENTGSDLNDRLKKFIAFFTATRAKFSGYESIDAVRRYETSRAEIGNRFTRAGVTPKTHPWCPTVCDDIVLQEAAPPSLDDGFPIATKEYEKLVSFSAGDVEDLGKDQSARKKEALDAIRKAADSEGGEGGGEDASVEVDESSDTFYQTMLERVILVSQLAAGNEYPSIVKLKEDLELAEPHPNNETAGLITEVIEMLQVYTEPASIRAAEAHPSTWAYATCFLADCYSGVGDERAMIQAKVRSEDQYTGNTKLSINVRDAILEGEMTDLGYKSILKVCELRYDEGGGAQWWERGKSETPKAFLQVSMRSKEHIDALVSAHKTSVLDALPSLERLSPEKLKKACPKNAMVKAGKVKLETCENLQQAYFCRENGAIVDMVHKEQCTKENKAFCTFQQSMIMPCLYEDCLGPAEKAAVPVKCMESSTAYGRDKEWVCGYRRVGKEKGGGGGDDHGECDCGKMRTLQASMAHRLFLGIADFVRKNAWLIATVAMLVVGTGICLAFPTCMAMMGVQSNVPADALGNMADAGQSLGCSGDAMKKLLDMNPGVAMPGGGPWHVSRAVHVSGRGGFGGMMGSLGGTLKNSAAIATRKYATIPTPFSVSSGLNAHALDMDKAVNVFGDKLQGAPFRTDYIKPNSVLTVPPGCSNFGAGVDYTKAGAQVFGKLLAGVTMAKGMFDKAKAFLSWFNNLGIKSYDDEFEADALFRSGVPITLRRDDVPQTSTHRCLGVKEAAMDTPAQAVFHANFMKCTSQDVIWRGDVRQRDDDEGTYTKRLYRVARYSSTSGEQHAFYASDYVLNLGVADGYGPGRCLRWISRARSFTAQDCPDSLLPTDTDFELKSNGMLCVNDCKQCVVIDKKTQKLALEHCGEPVQKETALGNAANNVKRLFGGGDYQLKDNIVWFKAVPLAGSAKTSTDGKAFDDTPSAQAWRMCNWVEGSDGKLSAYLNDEWPLAQRADRCRAVGSSCGFDAEDGMCKPVMAAAAAKVERRLEPSAEGKDSAAAAAAAGGKKTKFRSLRSAGGMKEGGAGAGSSGRSSGASLNNDITSELTALEGAVGASMGFGIQQGE
jgi:hypothetical protein